MPRVLLLLVSLTITTTLFGQATLSEETQSYVSQPRGTYVLQNLTVLDGTGEPAKTNHDIVIDGDRIITVGEDLEVPDMELPILMRLMK